MEAESLSNMCSGESTTVLTVPCMCNQTYQFSKEILHLVMHDWCEWDVTADKLLTSIVCCYGACIYLRGMCLGKATFRR